MPCGICAVIRRLGGFKGDGSGFSEGWKDVRRKCEGGQWGQGGAFLPLDLSLLIADLQREPP